MNEEYIDAETVAKKLGCHSRTVLTAIENKELTAITGIWKGYRTTEQWVQEWLDRKTLKAEPVRAGE